MGPCLCKAKDDPIQDLKIDALDDELDIVEAGQLAEGGGGSVIPAVASDLLTYDMDVVVQDPRLRCKNMKVPVVLAPHIKLINLALQESQRAFYAQRNCETLVRMMAALQALAWSQKEWLGSKQFILNFEELIKEIVRWMQIFSRTGWLARLELFPVADQQVFQRFVEQSIELLEQFSAFDQIEYFRSKFQFTPTSEDLGRKIQELGGLAEQGEKLTQGEKYELLEKLDFYLTRDASDYRRLYDLEISLVLAKSLPGPHQCIRHQCLQLIWFWAAPKQQHLEWKVFWERLIASLRLFGSEDLIGNTKAIKEYLNDEAKLQVLQNSISKFTLWSRQRDFVNAVEIDMAFPPHQHIEQCMDILYQRHILKLNQLSSKFNNNNNNNNLLVNDEGYESADEEVFEDCYTAEVTTNDSGQQQNPSLFGRNEILENLEKKVAANKEQIFHISGFVGVGKSAIALQLSENLFQHKMWNQVFYVNLRGIGNSQEALEKLCTCMRIPRLVQGMPADKQIQTWSDNHGNYTGRVGLILDNMDQLFKNLEQNQEFWEIIIDVLSLINGLQLISTARSELPNFFSEISYLNFEQILLPPLNAEFSVEVLEEKIVDSDSNLEKNNKIEKNDSWDLLMIRNKCDGIPLLLQIAASIINSGFQSANQVGRILDFRPNSNSNSQQNGKLNEEIILFKVRKLLQIVFENLHENQRMALIGLSTINRTLRSEVAELLIQQGMQNFKSECYMHALYVRGLLQKYEFEILDECYVMEGGILEVLKNQDQSEQIQIQVKISNLFLTVQEISNSIRMRCVEFMLENLEFLKKLIQKGFNSAAMRYLDTHAYIFDHGLHMLRGLDQNQQQIIIQNSIGKFSYEVACVMNQSQLSEIINVFQIWLNNFQQKQSTTQQSNTQNQIQTQLKFMLGEFLLVQGKSNLASQYFKQCLNQQRGIYMYALSLYLQQQYNESTQIVMKYQQYNTIQEQYVYGMAQQALGNFQSAQEIYINALNSSKIQKRFVFQALISEKLGKLFYQTKQFQKSKDYYIDAYKILEQMEGALNLRTVDCLMEYACVNASTKEFIIFQRAALECISVLKELVGEDDLRVANFMAKMALVYEQQKDYQNSEFFYATSLKIKSEKSNVQQSELANLLAGWKRVAKQKNIKIKYDTYQLISNVSQTLIQQSSSQDSKSSKKSWKKLGQKQKFQSLTSFPAAQKNTRKDFEKFLKTQSLPFDNLNIRESVNSSRTPRQGVPDSGEETDEVPKLQLTGVVRSDTHGTPGAPRVGGRNVAQETIQPNSVAPFGQSSSSSSHAVTVYSEWKANSMEKQPSSSYSNIDISIQSSNQQQEIDLDQFRKSINSSLSSTPPQNNNNNNSNTHQVDAHGNTVPILYPVPKELIDQITETLANVQDAENVNGDKMATFEQELARLTAAPENFEPQRTFYNYLYQVDESIENMTQSDSVDT